MTVTIRIIRVAVMLASTTGSCAWGQDDDAHTTVSRDANGDVIITQSGANPATRIERTPGRTTIYRHSGGNTAIVVQGTATDRIPQSDKK